jgi:hypothetical protein
MAKVYTSRSEESTIDNVLRKGFCVPGSKRTVLRLALALSLKQPIPPGEEFDQLPGGREGGKEYGLDVLTGESQKESEAFVDAFRALLSVYHQQDLFGDDVSFVRYLQRHIHRGLREVQTSWRDSHHSKPTMSLRRRKACRLHKRWPNWVCSPKSSPVRAGRASRDIRCNWPQRRTAAVSNASSTIWHFLGSRQGGRLSRTSRRTEDRLA